MFSEQCFSVWRRRLKPCISEHMEALCFAPLGLAGLGQWAGLCCQISTMNWNLYLQVSSLFHYQNDDDSPRIELYFWCHLHFLNDILVSVCLPHGVPSMNDVIIVYKGETIISVMGCTKYNCSLLGIYSSPKIGNYVYHLFVTTFFFFLKLIII